MTTYFKDFGSESTGSPPADWTEEVGGISDTVEADAAAPSGQEWQIPPGSAQGYKIWSWDDIDGDANRDDVEILVMMDLANGLIADDMGFVIRGSNRDSGPDGYHAWFYDGTIELAKRDASGFTSLGTAAKSPASGEQWWIRLRANGTTISVKAWQDGTGEPGSWDVQVTDSDISGVGYIGVFRFKGTNQGAGRQDFWKVGVGTAGDTAPSSAAPAPPSKPAISVDGAEIGESFVGVGKTGGDSAASIDHTDAHVDTSDGFTPGAGNLAASTVGGGDGMDVGDGFVLSSRTPGTIEFITIVDYNEADESDGGAAADDVKYRLAPSVDTNLVLSDHSTDPDHGVAWSVTDNTGTDPGGPYPRIVQHKLQADPWSNATEEIVSAGVTSGEFLGYSPGDTVDVRPVTFHTDLFQATDPGDGRIRSAEANAPSASHTTTSGVPLAVFQHHYRQMRA